MGYHRGKPRRDHIDWSTVGHVHTVGWGTNREDGGPDGVAIEVHFRGDPRVRVVFLDADDVAAILDEVQDAPGTGRALAGDDRRAMH